MTDYRNRITGLEYVASKDLTPHPGNWREHGKAQTEALRGVLAEVGIAGALLAYRSERNGGALTVIDGHLRKDAAPQKWPVLVLDVDDGEADYLLATHDPLAAMATADAAALDALLSSVNSGEAAVQAMLAELAKEAGLYGEPVGDDPGPQIDKAEELRQKWGTESGQLWQLGEHRLICGDCTDKSVVDRVMGGEKADCVFTSPPYNQGGKGKRLAPFYGGEGDDRTKDEYRDFLLSVLSVMAGSCKDDTSVLWNVMYNAKSRDDYGKVVFSDNNPFLVQETIVWDKGHGFNVSTRGILSRSSELIFLMSLGEEYQTKQGQYDTWFNTWKIGTQGSQTEGHGAAFPVELPEKGIELFCAGDIVLDPFLGSGTTLIACERLGRRCRGIEISPAYVAVTLERWSVLTGKTPELLP